MFLFGEVDPYAALAAPGCRVDVVTGQVHRHSIGSVVVVLLSDVLIIHVFALSPTSVHVDSITNFPWASGHGSRFLPAVSKGKGCRGKQWMTIKILAAIPQIVPDCSSY